MATQSKLKKRQAAPLKGWRPSAAQIAVAAAIGIGLLFAVYTITQNERQNAASAEGSSGYNFAVGEPGHGEAAPDFTLPATSGEQVSLADFGGQNVLLYFHEGGGCQPCWDQIADVEDEWAEFEAAGVDAFLPITTDPVDIHTRKMAADGLDTVAVSDPDLAVSEQYDTNAYGMMRGTTNGHSFILVDGEGTIVWRADYGGEPDYTMYLPVDAILADLEADRSDQ
ncbi:hypothetical protein GCM10027447_33280 [Glycomyces halotolerans]